MLKAMESFDSSVQFESTDNSYVTHTQGDEMNKNFENKYLKTRTEL